MTAWKPEADRWRKAHDGLERELRHIRGVLDTLRGFLRKKGLMDECMEFALSAAVGEEEAAKLLKECREERERNAAKGAQSR